MSQGSHPSPQRARVSALMLAAAFFAAPIAWLAHISLMYGIANYACAPGLPLTRGEIDAAIWLIDALALSAAAGGTFLAWKLWAATRREHPSSTKQLLDVGEGRTRFLALIGWLAGLGFFTATLFDIAMLVVAPRCVL